MKRSTHIHALGLISAASTGSTATSITSLKMSAKKLGKKISSSPLAIITTGKSGAMHATTSKKKMKKIASGTHSAVLGVITSAKDGSLTAGMSKQAFKKFKKSKKFLSLKKTSRKSIIAAFSSSKKAKKIMKIKTTFSGSTATSSIKKPLSLKKSKKLWIKS